MPTVLTHPVAALACRLAAGREAVPARLLMVGALGSTLPDIDAIGFWLGVPYGHWLGHRGFTHSFAFALLVAWVASRFATHLRSSRLTTFATVALATGTHGALDALTSGGLGIAFFSPFSNARFFFPWRPVLVSPISVLGFFEPRSLGVIRSELLWVWLPFVLVGWGAGAVRWFRRAT